MLGRRASGKRKGAAVRSGKPPPNGGKGGVSRVRKLAVVLSAGARGAFGALACPQVQDRSGMEAGMVTGEGLAGGTEDRGADMMGLSREVPARVGSSYPSGFASRRRAFSAGNGERRSTTPLLPNGKSGAP